MPVPVANLSDSDIPIKVSEDVARDIDGNLTAWFKEFQRPLEFRETDDPYAVMVAEFMLQQTTVTAVEPYFARFMKRFPSLTSLAKASEDDVLAMWAGLGYYRRARQLQASAKTLQKIDNGSFPKDVAALQKLPGFGRYTAGALVSRAYDLPAPILEANTIRVFSRLAGVNGMIGDTVFTKTLWMVSERLVSFSGSPRVFNNAAMELGSLICRPEPLCAECPLQYQCVAHQTGVASKIPQTRPRKKSISINEVCLAVADKENRYLVRRIPPGQWHAGMWQFPGLRVEDQKISEKSLAPLIDQLAVKIQVPRPLATLRYQVTHHKVTCHVFHCQTEEFIPETFPDDIETRFMHLHSISDLPMGSAQKKLLTILSDLPVSKDNL